MSGPLEYCPNCEGTRNTTVTIGLTTSRLPDGSEADSILYHLHCSSCNTYLLSYPCLDDVLEPEGIDIPNYLGIRV